ncbi:hypothetical protein [Legionella clemsonensis]|uniref:Uncharacterized protein n=1 Tax=Legionella clemsonensis TaxID=1867846 RepID=A0A222P2Y1_9GAMM|nr:hypothetical protein [Legionella clemsonensis]ASQ46196.1 hypothetical protein clem_08220 [Legionella clemsonensis]
MSGISNFSFRRPQSASSISVPQMVQRSQSFNAASSKRDNQPVKTVISEAIGRFNDIYNLMIQELKNELGIIKVGPYRSLEHKRINVFYDKTYKGLLDLYESSKERVQPKAMYIELITLLTLLLIKDEFYSSLVDKAERSAGFLTKMRKIVSKPTDTLNWPGEERELCKMSQLYSKKLLERLLMLNEGKKLKGNGEQEKLFVFIIKRVQFYYSKPSAIAVLPQIETLNKWLAVLASIIAETSLTSKNKYFSVIKNISAKVSERFQLPETTEQELLKDTSTFRSPRIKRERYECSICELSKNMNTLFRSPSIRRERYEYSFGESRRTIPSSVANEQQAKFRLCESWV